MELDPEKTKIANRKRDAARAEEAKKAAEENRSEVEEEGVTIPAPESDQKG